MALLVLARAVLGERIAVATVDHGLRPAAVDECALVENLCAAQAISCSVLRVSVGEGNVQEQARLARYRALGEWAGRRGLSAIATAHHADDQAETLLMRLNRGSGLGGLAGIREKTPIAGSTVEVLRPLLGFRREELRSILEGCEIPFVEDPSNRDERYDRVRMRHALARSDWIDPAALARSAAHLAEADAALQSFADLLWSQQAVATEDELSAPWAESFEITGRLLLRALSEFGGDATLGEAIAFLKTVDRRANFAGVLIERRGDRFICRAEPPRRRV